MSVGRIDPAALGVAVLIACASPLAAQDLCTSTVNGDVIAIDPDALETSGDGAGLRERLLAWPTRNLNRMTGRNPACDSETLIAYLSHNIPADQIDDYCLSEQDDAGFILVPGERNFRGRCTTTACDKVNTTKDGAVGVAGTIAKGVANKTLGIEYPSEEDEDDAPNGIVHSSGAAILTGTTGYIASNLGAIGTGLTTALSAPAVIAASAVTVVAVGGAVYLCRD